MYVNATRTGLVQPVTAGRVLVEQTVNVVQDQETTRVSRVFLMRIETTLLDTALVTMGGRVQTVSSMELATSYVLEVVRALVTQIA